MYNCITPRETIITWGSTPIICDCFWHHPCNAAHDRASTIRFLLRHSSHEVLHWSDLLGLRIILILTVTVLWMVTKHLNVNVSLVHSIHLAPIIPVMFSALSTSFISLKAFWELYISSNLVLESSGITPGCWWFVWECNYKLSGSIPRESIYVLWE